MSLILNIDTATEHASVCLSKNGKSLLLKESSDQKHHGAFLQPAIQQIMQESGVSLADVDAIAVTEGPGSYTGLRVALASAKGLCYALQKPLITINTLQVMAQAALKSAPETDFNTIFCPMIDARRMEVFTAIYSSQLETLEAPQAKILDENSFAENLAKNTVVFSGSGSIKFKPMCVHPNSFFSAVQHSAIELCLLSQTAYDNQHFADLAYSEPFYLKPFFMHISKK
ncbi:MAG: tRNA (adenosine(37)-N6)-threonylcarbamoyltransferase complex dimerization subunit type 1 TsaB [Chitinophagaceae bacterium]|nr:tRNA (adenosine(37)-N6)-threonylcarbamoyltransferase complex dimerization subunit type 1 TsaB [Chitinophagaceae bacterium]